MGMWAGAGGEAKFYQQQMILFDPLKELVQLVCFFLIIPYEPKKVIPHLGLTSETYVILISL